MKGVFIRRSSVVSPIQKVDEIFSLVGELKRLKINLETSILEVESHLARAQKIQKGEPGKDGMHGVSPDPEIVAMNVMRRIRQPRDGKDAVINHDEIAQKVLKLLPKVENGKPGADGKSVSVDDVLEAVKKKLKVENIPGLKNEIDLYRNQLAGKIYGKDTWARGGGDTVAAGTNVTITKDVNGNKVINAGSSSIGYQVPTSGVVDGSNKVFSWATAPNVIVLDNGNAMNKVSSDGTVNWVGTTTTTLAQAPNFNIYATA